MQGLSGHLCMLLDGSFTKYQPIKDTLVLLTVELSSTSVCFYSVTPERKLCLGILWHRKDTTEDSTDLKHDRYCFHSQGQFQPINLPYNAPRVCLCV